MPHSENPDIKADILVIDDTPENLHLLANMLKDLGYKVRSVTKGATALRAAQAAPPDLILLDINMPQMNGYEVCQRLKANPHTAEIPVIFISAMGETLDKVKAFEVGGVDYVTKPFQVEEVLARIQTHLALRSLQQQLQTQNQQLQNEIRDRKLAEEKFTKAFRSSPSPIALISMPEGQLIEVNPSFVAMVGYAHDALIGKAVTDLNLGIEPDAYANGVQELLESGCFLNQELELVTGGGDRRTVLLSVELIELEGHTCALSIINDITERKRLENEFISLVSHELRTPMNSIIGSLDLLKTGQLGTLTDQGQQILTMAITNTERLIRLVNDILDLERMKSGMITMRKEWCCADHLLKEAIAAMQGMADQANVSLVTRTAQGELWADPDRMIQALTNLLSNAIKFSEPGKTIWLTAQRVSTNQLQIDVKDEGRGIPEEKQQTIFERFQQVDASDSRKKSGTGLGLAICRQIVQQHDGKIWVESVVGEGSTFRMQLPIAVSSAICDGE
jgi:PAS domain S-box-containing protein